MAFGLQDYIALPPGFNPRTLQLAAELRRDPRYAAAGTPQLVAAVLDRLRTGGYTYTLEPGVYGATHGRRVLVRPQGRVFANTSPRPSWC